MMGKNSREEAKGRGHLPGWAWTTLLASALAMSGCEKGADQAAEIGNPPLVRIALDAESQEAAKNIQRNFKDFLRTNRVPAGAKVRLRWVKKSILKGLYEAKLTIEDAKGRSGHNTFFFDEDAKHFVLGPVYTVGEIYRPRVPMRDMVLLDRPSKGPATAPVTIAEYSDFACPYCGAAAQTINAVLDKYKEKVRLVFKHMPLGGLHSWARGAAITAECAAAQKPSAFWYFHDYFYDPVHRLNDENFREKTETFAKTINLDVAKLRECVEKEEPGVRVDYDLSEASNLGFSATPTFVINGVVIVGNQPISVFEEIIQEQLMIEEAKEEG
jgi:protein-disulfide isomerase